MVVMIMTNAIIPKKIWMARTMEMLESQLRGEVDADGTARADLYIGGREKFIIVNLCGLHLTSRGGGSG